MSRFFTGDFSTGDFTQWPAIQNAYLNDVGSNWPAGLADNYAVQIVPSGDLGHCARFEVRDGDTASGPNERCEIQGGASVNVGQTAWYAFSIKFDETWPTNQDDLGWASVTQFKGEGTSPVLQFGWLLSATPGQRNGYWYLCHNPQNTNPSGGWSFVGTNSGYGSPIAEFPLELGRWHDIKMQVQWKQDNTGFVNLWRNNQRVTFTELGGGGTTFTGQTVAQNGGSPGQEVTTIKVAQGIYRQPNVSPTGIVYIAGTRAATNEASL